MFLVQIIFDLCDKNLYLLMFVEEWGKFGLYYVICKYI